MDAKGETPAAGVNVFDEAMEVITGAQAAGIPVRLVGGLAVRFLTPDFPPRARDGQDLDRFTRSLGEDWGWWRTVTLNLDKIRTLARGEGAHLVPSGAPFAADEQLGRLRQAADDAPKSLKWKLRSKVGERKRWYELPEESEHY